MHNVLHTPAVGIVLSIRRELFAYGSSERPGTIPDARNGAFRGSKKDGKVGGRYEVGDDNVSLRLVIVYDRHGGEKQEAVIM
jgi:hypothetical protein